MDGFLQARETLERMLQHSEEKRWSRVTKEFSGLPKKPRIPGKRGARLTEDLEALRRAAGEMLRQRDELRERLPVP